MEDKVSIILPTYGRPDGLSLAIDSILNQTYLNWELIVVDDNDPLSASRKQTEKIMSVYSKNNNIFYLKHECNKNGAAARNTGIAFSSGKYISFLDDDDVYHPERLRYCVNVLKNSPIKYGGVYTGCKFYHNGHFYRTCKSAHTGNFLVETLSTIFKSYSGSNLFFRASVIKDIGGFDESFRRHQDYEFLVRFFLKYDLLGIQKVLLIKNENGNNLPEVEKLANIKKQYLQKYAYVIDDLSEKDRNAIFFSNFIGLAQRALETNKLELYRYFFQKASSYKKASLWYIFKFKILALVNRLK